MRVSVCLCLFSRNRPERRPPAFCAKKESLLFKTSLLWKAACLQSSEVCKATRFATSGLSKPAWLPNRPGCRKPARVALLSAEPLLQQYMYGASAMRAQSATAVRRPPAARTLVARLCSCALEGTGASNERNVLSTRVVKALTRTSLHPVGARQRLHHTARALQVLRPSPRSASCCRRRAWQSAAAAAVSRAESPPPPPMHILSGPIPMPHDCHLYAMHRWPISTADPDEDVVAAALPPPPAISAAVDLSAERRGAAERRVR